MALNRGWVVKAPAAAAAAGGETGTGEEPTLTVVPVGAVSASATSLDVQVLAHEPASTRRGASDLGATPLGRIVSRRIVEAETQRDQILLGAYQEAARILAAAREQTKSAREDAEREGRAAATAALAAHWVTTRTDEQRAVEGSEERMLTAARALAERLLGRELSLRPEAIVDLARVVLSAVSRARRVAIRAHRDDVAALQSADLARFFEDAKVAISVEVDDTRQRGSLRVESDLGVLDGDLAPQLDRLVAALRS
jgi:flagellar biosynthesis/type III secretory pathway protein FliH